jgi:hypothetical protein
MVTFKKLAEFMNVKRILYIAMVLLISCKEEDPQPVDLFAGDYTVVNIIEEYDPEESGKVKFLAPKLYTVIKTEFLDPTTGELISAYKFEDDLNRFMGLTDGGENILVGTDDCPNREDLNGVSITFSTITNLYTLKMQNCEGRDIIAEYSIGI